MNDKEIVMDILDNLKCLSVNMTYALNEASCAKLYKEYFHMFEIINKYTKEFFDLAYKKGYYQLEKEDSKKIKSSLKTLSQELESCNCEK